MKCKSQNHKGHKGTQKEEDHVELANLIGGSLRED
jgi:hypothetical protein